MSKLSQESRFNASYQFEIDDSGLLIKTKKGIAYSEIHKPFEQIGGNKTIKVYDNKTLLAAGIGLFAISLTLFIGWLNRADVEFAAIIIWPFVAAALVYTYFKQRRTRLILYLNKNEFIEFYTNIPTELAVNEFVDELISRRNKYLKDKYCSFQKHLDYQSQYDNLNWLLTGRVISKNDYDKSLAELNNLFNNNPASTIGFSKLS